MTFSSGMLWWTVFGALLGWAGAWWLGRSTQRLLTEPVIRIVERQLDNPQHLMRIARLERELVAAREDASTQRRRAEALAAASPVIVEPAVDRPVADLVAIGEDASRPAQRRSDSAPDGDIERVEGIGPKIAELLRARGLGSFGALAGASPGTLREILDDSGPAYRIADPSTWPEQARLAADGRWDELRSLQDTLDAGRRPGRQADPA